MNFWRTNTDIRSWLPSLQCHRGYWVDGLQQNSLKSVQRAKEMGYGMAEFDVRLTKDEQVILFHDEKFRSRKVESFDYLEFKNATQSEYPDVGTLEAVLMWFSQLSKTENDFHFKLNIEIKSKKVFDGRLEKLISALIEKYGVSDWVLVSSFNPFSLYRIRKMQPSIRRALLLTRDQESNFLLNHMVFNFLSQPDALHLRWNDFDEVEFAKLAKQVPIVLWTVNDTEKANDLKGKIFGIISDQITPAQR